MTEPTKKEKRSVVNIKEKLYDRLTVLRACVTDAPVDRLDHHFQNEIDFLQDILDWIERN
jgi:hypothetical protein